MPNSNICISIFLKGLLRARFLDQTSLPMTQIHPLLTKASFTREQLQTTVKRTKPCAYFGYASKLGGGGVTEAFCPNQLPPKLVAVILPLGLCNRSRSVSWRPPPGLQTRHPGQTLWRHLRPFSLTAPTLQHTYFFAFSVSKLQPKDPNGVQVFANLKYVISVILCFLGQHETEPHTSIHPLWLQKGKAINATWKIKPSSNLNSCKIDQHNVCVYTQFFKYVCTHMYRKEEETQHGTSDIWCCGFSIYILEHTLSHFKIYILMMHFCF